MTAGLERRRGKHADPFAAEFLPEAVARGQRDADSGRIGEVAAELLHGEINQDVLRAEPVQLDLHDPLEEQRGEGMAHEVESAVGAQALDCEDVDVEFEAR